MPFFNAACIASTRPYTRTRAVGLGLVGFSTSSLPSGDDARFRPPGTEILGFRSSLFASPGTWQLCPFVGLHQSLALIRAAALLKGEANETVLTAAGSDDLIPDVFVAKYRT